jgi:hypothetical protein
MEMFPAHLTNSTAGWHLLPATVAAQTSIEKTMLRRRQFIMSLRQSRKYEFAIEFPTIVFGGSTVG